MKRSVQLVLALVAVNVCAAEDSDIADKLIRERFGVSSLSSCPAEELKVTLMMFDEVSSDLAAQFGRPGSALEAIVGLQTQARNIPELAVDIMDKIFGKYPVTLQRFMQKYLRELKEKVAELASFLNKPIGLVAFLTDDL